MNNHPETCFCNQCASNEMMEPLSDEEIDMICDFATEAIHNLTLSVKKVDQLRMIQRKKKQETLSAGDGSGKNGLPFLNIKHLTNFKENDSSKFSILWAGNPKDAEVPNQFNYPVVVKLQRHTSGEKFWWMLADTNPNLDILCDEMSEDETKWIGRELLVYNDMPNKVSEKIYAKCEVVHKKEAAKAR